MNVDIINTANGYSMNCHVGSSVKNDVHDRRINVNGDIWYDCNIPGYVPDNPLTTRVFFDSNTSQFAINQTWICDDKGTDRP